MSNNQSQTPTGVLDKNDRNKIKTKNENSNNNKGYNKSNKIYGGNLVTSSSSDTSSQKFECGEPSIGVVLGLCLENFRRKHP